MGTNFYLHESACSECGRADPRRHIGKRSIGWVFLLHVEAMTNRKIPNTLEGWEELFAQDGLDILDEWGVHWTAAAMLLIINDPEGKRRIANRPYNSYLPQEGFPYDRSTEIFQ